MGDRANLIVHTSDPDYDAYRHQHRECGPHCAITGDECPPITHEPPVWIYTHWHGHELPTMLATALDLPAARARVGDPAYLTRVIFCSFMRQADDLDGETGWGISTTEQDNEHDYVHLDAQTGCVCISPSSDRPASGWKSADQFIRETKAAIDS